MGIQMTEETTPCMMESKLSICKSLEMVAQATQEQNSR